MNNTYNQTLPNELRWMVSILILGISMNASAFLGFGNSVSWKEEVLLHDGSKIVVERSQSYGGRHEIGQGAPIKEHGITFTLPGTNKSIIWKDEFSKDIGHANFDLLALHILNGTPYIVAKPNLCLAYNKWGRPNPPYVIFKYDRNAWQRIQLTELPVEFKEINLVINTISHEKRLVAESPVPASAVKKLNSSLTQPENKTILREAYPDAAGGCSEMIRTKDGWEGLGFLRSQPSYEVCLKYCEQKGIAQQDCACKTIFGRK